MLDILVIGAKDSRKLWLHFLSVLINVSGVILLGTDIKIPKYALFSSFSANTLVSIVGEIVQY